MKIKRTPISIETLRHLVEGKKLRPYRYSDSRHDIDATIVLVHAVLVNEGLYGVKVAEVAAELGIPVREARRAFFWLIIWGAVVGPFARRFYAAELVA